MSKGGRRGERSCGQTLHTSVIMNGALCSETCNLFLKRLLQGKEVQLVSYPRGSRHWVINITSF